MGMEFRSRGWKVSTGTLVRIGNIALAHDRNAYLCVDLADRIWVSPPSPLRGKRLKDRDGMLVYESRRGSCLGTSLLMMPPNREKRIPFTPADAEVTKREGKQ